MEVSKEEDRDQDIETQQEELPAMYQPTLVNLESKQALAKEMEDANTAIFAKDLGHIKFFKGQRLRIPERHPRASASMLRVLLVLRPAKAFKKFRSAQRVFNHQTRNVRRRIAKIFGRVKQGTRLVRSAKKFE